MLPRSFPCFALSSTNLNLSTTYGQCWESTRNTIFWWGRLNGGSGFFRSRMAEHQKWGCTNLECTTIGPRDLSQAKCIVVHEQITKEIEERKYLNECTPFGYVACGYDLTAVCGFYIPSFDYVMAAQSVFRNNNLPYQAAIKDERAWYKIKPCVASQRHRPTKGWPAVRLAVPRWIVHCHRWPMIDSHGSLWTSTSLKSVHELWRDPWTLMIVDGLPWKSMLFTMKYHERPCTFIDFYCQFRLGSAQNRNLSESFIIMI